MNMGMMDGSFRKSTASINQRIWSRAINPNDGGPLGQWQLEDRHRRRGWHFREGRDSEEQSAEPQDAQATVGGVAFSKEKNADSRAVGAVRPVLSVAGGERIDGLDVILDAETAAFSFSLGRGWNNRACSARLPRASMRQLHLELRRTPAEQHTRGF